MKIRGKQVWVMILIVLPVVIGAVIHLWRTSDELDSNQADVSTLADREDLAPSSIDDQKKTQNNPVPTAQEGTQGLSSPTEAGTTEALLLELRKVIEGKTDDLPGIISKLKSTWQGHPPVDLLLAEISKRDAPTAYRQILIDALVSYKRTLTSHERAKVLRGLETLLSDSEDDEAVRIVAMQRYASLYLLMAESGAPVGANAGDILYDCMQNDQDGSLVYRQALTSLATIQDKRIVPKLKDDLKRADQLESERLRTVVGAVGILREREMKDQLITILDTTANARVYRATVYSLGRMADYSVIGALNRNYDKLDAGPLVKQTFKSNKDLITKGIQGDDTSALRECIAATARTADEDCLNAITGRYPKWDEQTRLYAVGVLRNSSKIPTEYVRKMCKDETSQTILGKINVLSGE